MKKLILLIALVGCGTDVCPAGSKMGAEGHCVVPVAGAKAPSPTRDEPSIDEPSYDAGEPIRVAVGGSGGGEVVDAGIAEASGGRGGEGGGSAGRPSLPGQTADAGGSEPGSGGEGGRKEAGGSPALDSGVPDASLDSGQIQDPPRCGDGHKDPDELCDGDCVTACDDSDPCTVDTLRGAVATCDAVCSHTPITKAANGDQCCPTGANSGNDNDCPVSCGNGVIDSGEICDGNCKTSCPAVDACHPGKLQGSPQMCNVTCATSAITTAKSDDGCCPDSANANSDSDCTPVCGNGVKENGEQCDGDCATSCPSNGCSVGKLSGSGCNVVCSTTTITDKVNGDGCCPANSDFNSDSDCAPPPGCTQPSASNMLKNPGFATGTIGWDIGGDYGTVAWTVGDAESCSASGSAQLAADHQVGRIISQCMPVAGGTYHFSARIKSGGDGGQTTCAVVAYQLADCKGSGKALAEADWVNVDWGPQTSYAFDVDASMTSIYVGCYINANGVAATSEVDMLYLGKEDKAF